MKFNYKHLLILFLILASLYVNYMVFISFRLQNIIRYDINNKKLTLTDTQIESLSNQIPNINTFTIPLKAYQAYYYLNKQNFSQSLEVINTIDSKKTNPYIHFEDYIKSVIFENLNDLDSSFYYAKQSFYNWPKNLDHYEQLNKIAVRKRDTLEITKAFSLIDSIYYDRNQYHSIFIKSLAKAKLSYLVKYDSVRVLYSNDELYGNWRRVLEYEGDNIEYLDDSIITFAKDVYYDGNDSLFYNVNENDLFLYPIFRKDYLLTTNKLYYSDTFETLLIVPSQKNGNIQARYYKKVK